MCKYYLKAKFQELIYLTGILIATYILESI